MNYYQRRQIDDIIDGMKNPEAYLARKHALRERDRPKKRIRGRLFARRKLGVPEAPYPAPLICECCAKPPGLKGFAIDHDHKTGEFRGWLCFACNVGLGKLGDDAAGIRRALAYLERPRGLLARHEDCRPTDHRELPTT